MDENASGTDACQLSLRVTSNNIKYTYDPHNSSMLRNAKLVSVENCSQKFQKL